MHIIKQTLAVAALSAGVALPAQAYTELSLAFKQPTGTVSATDTIHVWVTLSVSGDEAFTFDTSVDDPLFGLTPSLLPETGYNNSLGTYDVPFDSYTEMTYFISRNCSGTFTNGCGDGAYSPDAATAENSWFTTEEPFTLNPGEQRDFLLYTLSPVGGSAAPGTYELYTVGLGLTVHGFDAEGNELEYDIGAYTCSSGDASCSFMRTVTAVPEPESWVMMLGGLFVAAGMAHRRSRIGQRG